MLHIREQVWTELIIGFYTKMSVLILDATLTHLSKAKTLACSFTFRVAKSGHKIS